jgi:HPt (histidine-containing phosphotransfer) domain-containing protein
VVYPDILCEKRLKKFRYKPISSHEGLRLPASAASPLVKANSIFEPDALLQRVMGDRPLAGLVLKTFLEDIPNKLNNLRKRLGEGDGAGIAREAHALTGASATVTAEGLRAIQEFDQFKETLEAAGWTQ